MPADESVGCVRGFSTYGAEELQRSMLCVPYHARVKEARLGGLPGMLALPKAAPRWSCVA